MALFKKSHSRGKPVVENASVSCGTTYVNSKKHYTIDLCAPGGPPYTYFQLLLSEAEMVAVADDLCKSVFERAQRAIRLEIA